ncbi:hypothetical protein GQR58_020167 [Nymphon striatum]|nr:hypothetical protein GQR58_020167 [Nymphon striatum]
MAQNVCPEKNLHNIWFLKRTHPIQRYVTKDITTISLIQRQWHQLVPEGSATNFPIAMQEAGIIDYDDIHRIHHTYISVIVPVHCINGKNVDLCSAVGPSESKRVQEPTSLVMPMAVTFLNNALPSSPTSHKASTCTSISQMNNIFFTFSVDGLVCSRFSANHRRQSFQKYHDVW